MRLMKDFTQKNIKINKSCRWYPSTNHKKHEINERKIYKSTYKVKKNYIKL